MRTFVKCALLVIIMVAVFLAIVAALAKAQPQEITGNLESVVGARADGCWYSNGENIDVYWDGNTFTVVPRV